MQGIPLFQAIFASMSNTILQRNSLLIPKNLNIIKYQLSGPYQYWMFLRRQLQWFYVTKSITHDQEQASIKQTKACLAPWSDINNPLHTTIMLKGVELWKFWLVTAVVNLKMELIKHFLCVPDFLHFVSQKNNRSVFKACFYLL